MDHCGFQQSNAYQTVHWADFLACRRLWEVMVWVLVCKKVWKVTKYVVVMMAIAIYCCLCWNMQGGVGTAWLRWVGQTQLLSMFLMLQWVVKSQAVSHWHWMIARLQCQQDFLVFTCGTVSACWSQYWQEPSFSSGSSGVASYLLAALAEKNSDRRTKTTAWDRMPSQQLVETKRWWFCNVVVRHMIFWSFWVCIIGMHTLCVSKVTSIS